MIVRCLRNRSDFSQQPLLGVQERQHIDVLAVYSAVTRPKIRQEWFGSLSMLREYDIALTIY
jgi:hypothetical protein